jgi:hypothetical protein
MKCLKGLEQHFDSFFVIVVTHMSCFTLIVVFRCIYVAPNPILRADSFSITMRS